MNGTGVVINQNIVAVMIGLAFVLTCLSVAYFFQKYLFARYHKKVPTRTEDDRE